MPQFFTISPAEDRLQSALRDHDDHRRTTQAAVTAVGLDADNDLWAIAGAAIASLARLIGQSCRDSRYCNDRPEVAALVARLSESIDDQIDTAAWAVIDASARLRAAGPCI